ncbi:TetR/AcrR family transcriptional regulator [Methanobrevibacter sp.]|uniref:TetR/AcrR family transcriptional regulator n=1 Tax=Methanobrevibacter sp. TaxID=66852 RepID=UPI0038653D9C
MDLELDSTSEKIVSATFKLLQKDGSEKATTKKIATEAGVNEVTIFRKFENKKNLIEITKQYYLQVLINTLEEIFVFDESQTIEEYLKISFYGILNLSDEDFSILKVAMEEVRGVSEKKNLISEVTDVILNKLEEFFKFQIDKGTVREDINSKSLAIMCFSVLFQSVILWKIYDKDLGFETIPYADDIMNILFEGINP